ncbi:MAG: hypothetical protein ACJA0C_001214 [Candidatus Endobugula sp.]|jgi:uncharacterized protein YcfJ
MYSLILTPAIAADMHPNHRFIVAATSLTAIPLTTLSFSADAKPYDNYARVTQVTPTYETYTAREPYRERHLEERTTELRKYRHRDTSTTPTIIGALIGRAIGNEQGITKAISV